MVLEATVLCLDNSEWMRNGDYTPTRLEAQHDAVNLICGAKTQSNPENTVGIISCAGRSPEVLVTLTGDVGKVLSSLHEVKVAGKLNFVSGLQVAQLALKHRQNKNQHQRVIMFVGSPLELDNEEIVRLGKRLKKNNIAVDVINFGEETQNTEKLEAFIGAVNSNENCHLITIPPGPHILSDILLTSPIVTGSEDAGSVNPTRSDFGGVNPNYGGVDPNLDPELALALKVSMEEERARQEAEVKKKSDSQPTTEKPSETSTIKPVTNEVEMSEAHVEEDDDDLAKALAMSMQNDAPAVKTVDSKPHVSTPPAPKPVEKPKDEEMTELEDDEEMRLALQMSILPKETASTQPSQTNESSAADINKVMEDPNFVTSVLMTLPGVDPNDDRIKSVLASISKEKKDEKDKEKKDDKDQNKNLFEKK